MREVEIGRVIAQDQSGQKVSGNPFQSIVGRLGGWWFQASRSKKVCETPSQQKTS
jgi:hypothetical protein